MLILWKAKEVKSTVKYNRLITLQHGHFRRVRRMKNGGVWRRLAGSLSGTRQIYLCGAVSTMLKHSKMDQAKRNMEQAKYDLRSFSRELNDVNMACNLNINTGDFLSFADYFFDGFVVDWVVQDRINNAKRQVEEAIRRTESIVNQLQRM